MILPSHCFGPYASESVSQARIREHQEALDDEWNAPIEVVIQKTKELMEAAKIQLKGHGSGPKELETFLGHLEDALGDLPLLRGE